MSHTISKPPFVCLTNKPSSVWLMPISSLFHFLLAICCFLNSVISGCLHRLLVDTSAYISVQRIKHALSVSALFVCIFTAVVVSGGGLIRSTFGDAERYSSYIHILLYSIQFSVFVQLPFFVFNFLGVVFLNVFTQRPKLQCSPLLCPFLCFRVVTRGLYPDLVVNNVQRNLETCKAVGLNNYIMEVVTDESVHLKSTKRCREIVVPVDYRTSNGALYKARALQYALEPHVDILSPGDWIVHLDEETLLTEDAVVGIVNFVSAAEHSFGQGVITYGHGKIVNWITTLADSIRVGVDYGCLRFCLAVLHKPVFSWKGSFIVADAEAEKKISFDHGPEASIAEDCYFACVAYSQGYSFGFIDGTMLEQSTFTLKDFVRQRRRWMQGILMTALSKKIPLRYRLGPALMSISGCILPVNLCMFLLSQIWPVPSSPIIALSFSFILGTVVFLFVMGTLQTFHVRQHGFWKCCLLALATLLCGLVACFLENISAVLVFWLPKSAVTSFYIVNKEIITKEFVKVV